MLNTTVTSRHFPHLGAFESARLLGSEEDVLSTTHHLELWRQDLDMLRASGIDQVRYPVPWNRIEVSPNNFDWSWMDGPMEYFRRTGMTPILDTMHLTSFPSWLSEGFSSQSFGPLYLRFLSKFSERYPWATHYTVFNEPLPATLFCMDMGLWPPFRRSTGEWVRMLINIARVICQATELLIARNPNAQFVHVDTGEHHQALDREAEGWVEYVNRRRFLPHDLILGRVTPEHPLYRFLLDHGVTLDDLHWLQDHRARVDVVGLDYYTQSEIDWSWNRHENRLDIRFPCSRPRGFAAVARDYHEHFKLPLMLSEANLRGTVADRLTWLKHMEEQCEQLVAGGVDFRGFCWYPSIDSTDWCHVLTRCTRSVDPQGIWWLDEDCWHRHESELSYWYSRLAQGTATAADLPAYELEPPVDRLLENYMPLMRHWRVWHQPGTRMAEVAMAV